MSMPLEDMEKAKKEVASSDEPKIPEIGYFYLAQQVNTLMQMLNETRNNIDIRFDNQRQEFKGEIKSLREEIDGLREETKNSIISLKEETKNNMSALREEIKNEIKELREEIKNDIKELRSEFNSIKTWFIGTVVGIVGIIVAIVGMILKS
ncbi:hypothetical protein [Thermoanaerobacterium sp. DL9XJH110]|uniref:hypothetical protein n=1 Tax=Thermoanaerobacterium sp. DL9XJH110 TaxID=3386643 RepID=UPI003BB493F5